MSSKLFHFHFLKVISPCLQHMSNSGTLFVKKNPTRCNSVSRFYYSIFIWSSTCFGRHTAHHQEPKTALAASGFSYLEGWWTCSWWTLLGTLCLTMSTNYQRMKNQRLPVQFWLLMMGVVSPETCWALCKYGIIKILIHCCILDFSLRIVLWCTDLRTSSGTLCQHCLEESKYIKLFHTVEI
jgi:hypothetical protein